MEKIGNMNLYKVNGVEFLRFPSLERTGFINHAFSTKHGGVSQNEFSSMNLSFGRGDSRENVIKNYEVFCKAAGFSKESLVASHQVHETKLEMVTKSDFGNGIYLPQKFDSADGLYTNVPGVTLVTYYADCVPLFFVDPYKKCIALSHAGWRGTVAEIAKKTVQTLTEEFNSDPKDIICAIGPSISKECYEVDDVVAQKVMTLPININDVLYPKENGKYLFDLWQCNKEILLSTGIKEENITISGICTRCRNDLLFSHRATGGKRGGMAAFMCIE